MEKNDKKFDDVIKMYDNVKVARKYMKMVKIFENSEEKEERAELFLLVVVIIWSIAMVVVGTQVSKNNIVLSI